MQKEPILYDPPPKKNEAKIRSKMSTGPERNKTIKKSSFRHKKLREPANLSLYLFFPWCINLSLINR